MIELTPEMRAAVKRRMGVPDGQELDPWMGAAIEDVLAIVERDNHVIRRRTPEEIASRPKPTRRLKHCIDNWPDAEEGEYNPSCCRWPKSCSATVYDPARVSDDDLEPEQP